MEFANSPARAPAPRGGPHSPGRTRPLRRHGGWERGEAARGLPESRAAEESRRREAGGAREPATPLGRGGGDSEVAGTGIPGA